MRARLRLPGSKSITNRALVLAALSDSPSVVRAPLEARDTSLAVAALRVLGCSISARGTDLAVSPPSHDSGSLAPLAVDVGNAGTVMRFLPAVAAVLSASPVAFDGDPRARERPVGALLGALRTLGVLVDDGGRGALPFTVHAPGSVPGGAVTLDASESSQLVSGLLLAAPRFADGVAVRHVGPPVPSLPHIEMTVRMLRDAGAEVEADSSARPSLWRVQAGRLDLGDLTVEPDLSNAGPFLAAALVTAGSVTILDWPADSLQASAAILDVLTRMGAVAVPGPGGMTVTGSGVINGIEADLRDIPELCLPLTSVAALASGPSVFTGVGHIRLQETDRLAAIVKEINALGGDVTELPDGLSVRPRPLRASPGHAFESYDDHRLVMAAAVLGLAVPGIEVPNVATVGKTFPDFTSAWAEMLTQGEHPPGATEEPGS